MAAEGEGDEERKEEPSDALAPETVPPSKPQPKRASRDADIRRVPQPMWEDALRERALDMAPPENGAGTGETEGVSPTHDPAPFDLPPALDVIRQSSEHQQHQTSEHQKDQADQIRQHILQSLKIENPEKLDTSSENVSRLMREVVEEHAPSITKQSDKEKSEFSRPPVVIWSQELEEQALARDALALLQGNLVAQQLSTAKQLADARQEAADADTRILAMRERLIQENTAKKHSIESTTSKEPPKAVSTQQKAKPAARSSLPSISETPDLSTGGDDSRPGSSYDANPTCDDPMQGVTYHGGGAHRKLKSVTDEADAGRPVPVWTQPHQPPNWLNDGWKWNGTGWQRTGQVSPQRNYPNFEEEDEEERPSDPTLAATHVDLDHTWRSATSTRWGPGQRAPGGSSH